MALPTEVTKEPKDLRYRKQHFPHAEDLVFDTQRKGFIPLPILTRKLLRHLSAPEFRILVYLHLRVSKYGICFPTQDEMAFELGLSGTNNLVPYLRSLESKKLISTRTSMGKKFYLVHDPRIGIQHLIDTGKIAGEDLDDLNQLCSDLKQQPFEAPRIIRRPATEAAESEIQDRAQSRESHAIRPWSG